MISGALRNAPDSPWYEDCSRAIVRDHKGESCQSRHRNFIAPRNIEYVVREAEQKHETNRHHPAVVTHEPAVVILVHTPVDVGKEELENNRAGKVDAPRNEPERFRYLDLTALHTPFVDVHTEEVGFQETRFYTEM